MGRAGRSRKLPFNSSLCCNIGYGLQIDLNSRARGDELGHTDHQIWLTVMQDVVVFAGVNSDEDLNEVALWKPVIARLVNGSEGLTKIPSEVLISQPTALAATRAASIPPLQDPLGLPSLHESTSAPSTDQILGNASAARQEGPPEAVDIKANGPVPQ